MKILVIENEYRVVQGLFDYVSEAYYNGAFEITQIDKSQEIKPFSSIENYDHVFLDISLAMKSDLDGYGILLKTLEENLSLKNIIIMTGNHLIEQKLKEKGINNQFRILSKPFGIKELLQAIKN